MARKPPLIPIDTPISAEVFARIDQAVRDAGYADAIEYSESIPAAKTAKEFASAAIYVIANGGMANSVALPIYDRCMKALRDGKSVTTVFGHPGKGAAMDWIWKHRRALYRKLKRADDVVEFCGTLPWVGVITKFHLAKNIGVDVAKPDVHLNRLAEAEGLTAQEICARLAKVSGYRIATVDLILWRAAANGIIHTRS